MTEPILGCGWRGEKRTRDGKRHETRTEKRGRDDGLFLSKKTYPTPAVGIEPGPATGQRRSNQGTGTGLDWTRLKTTTHRYMTSPFSSHTHAPLSLSSMGLLFDKSPHGSGTSQTMPQRSELLFRTGKTEPRHVGWSF